MNNLAPSPKRLAESALPPGAQSPAPKPSDHVGGSSQPKIPMLHLPIALLAAAANAPVQPVEAFVPESLAPNFAPALFQPAPVLQDEDGAIELSYTYFELGFTQFDPDQIDDEADAYYAKASIEIAFLYLFGSYQKQEFDLNNLEANNLQLGLGAHFDLGERLDLQADLAWLYSDFEADGTNFGGSEDGYQLRVGLRWLLLPWNNGGLEAEGNLMYRDLDNGINEDGAFGGQLGARVHFISILSIGAMYTQLESDSEVGFNARLSF